MISKIFSIFDAKAAAFITPFTLPTIAMAVRAFSDSANDPLHMFCKHSHDFTLYQVGSFDDETAALEFISPIQLIGNAAEYKGTENV